MKKEITRTLLSHFLSRSAHRHMQRVSKIAFSFEAKTPEEFSDEKYLNHSLSKINCDFLINPQHKQLAAKPSAFLKMNAIISNPCLLRPMYENNETSQIVTKMISTIKKLSPGENLSQVYGQIKQLILQMNQKQANQCRKYLLYINKWILNHKQNSKIETQQEGLQLRKLVIHKVCEGYIESHGHLQIGAELLRQQTLLKARQNIIEGDSEQAKLNYEIVFENLQNSEAIRMEALEYLCRSSQETGDATYLLAMMTKIKQQKGESKHMDCIRQALRELTHEHMKRSTELIQ